MLAQSLEWKQFLPFLNEMIHETVTDMMSHDMHIIYRGQGARAVLEKLKDIVVDG